MIRIKTILFILVSLFLFSGCTAPTLKCTSEEAYKESLKKIYDSQDSEKERLEIARAILYVISNGSETRIGGDSSMAYRAYQASSFFRDSDRLMDLDGKNASEIIKMGKEARKTWVIAHLPVAINSYKEKISSLEEKKVHDEKVMQTQQAASITNVTLDTEEMLAHGSNKPMGFVYRFMINFDAMNHGSLEIYRYFIDLEIKDSENTHAEPARYGEVTVEFKNPVLPGTVQKGTYEVSGNTLPYGKDRYTISAKLTGVGTTPNRFSRSPDLRFDNYAERELVELQEKLAVAEEELRAYQ